MSQHTPFGPNGTPETSTPGLTTPHTPEVARGLQGARGGADVGELCLRGPEAQLQSTAFSQTAVMVSSLAALEELKAQRPAGRRRASPGSGGYNQEGQSQGTLPPSPPPIRFAECKGRPSRKVCYFNIFFGCNSSPRPTNTPVQTTIFACNGFYIFIAFWGQGLVMAGARLGKSDIAHQRGFREQWVWQKKTPAVLQQNGVAPGNTESHVGIVGWKANL